jgi:hypothetical protein
VVNALPTPTYGAGYVEQRRSFLYKKIIATFPARQADPILLYGDIEGEFLRLTNAGLLTSEEGSVYSVLDFGVVGDGITDDTAALNAAAAKVTALNSKNTLYIPANNYKITGKVMISCQLDATEATFQYYGTGDALVIGDDTALNKVTFTCTYRLPQVYNMSRVSGWDGTSVGVRLVNLNVCKVYVTRIQDFEYGLVAYGKGGGFAYNETWLGYLKDNHVNFRGTADSTGWSNQNNYYGGRLEVTAAKGSVYDDVNCISILLDTASGTVSAPNNNTFHGTSLEGDRYQYYRIDNAGRYNRFINCRYESYGSAVPRIRYRTTATDNTIDGGYDSWKAVEIWDDSTVGSGGTIRDGVGGFYRQANTAGQVIPTAVNTLVTTWSSTGLNKLTYDGAGNFTPRVGTWRIKAKVTFANNATGVRKAFLTAAGSTIDVDEKIAGSTTQTMMVYGTFKFNGAQTFSVSVYQNSGADLALVTSSPYVKLEAEWLGY